MTPVNLKRRNEIGEPTCDFNLKTRKAEPHHAGWMPYSTAFYEADGVTPANYHPDPRDSYRQLWNKINGFGAWEDNPWIVAYTFTVQHGNVDQIERAAA